MSTGSCKLPPTSGSWRNCTQGCSSGADNRGYRETLVDLFDLLATDQISPLVAARIPLGQAAEAHRLLEQGGYAGKVVWLTELG